MLFLLSPAKSLNYNRPAEIDVSTQPLFQSEAQELVNILKEKTPAEIATLMKVSDTLATLNVGRFQAWEPKFNIKNSKQAILTFDGDVYDGLDASSLQSDDLKWVQNHLIILSGLYGVLRPLDLLQAYRLEMGTRLPNRKGKNLYDYWQDLIAPTLNEMLKKDKEPIVINLASQEYFKSVDLKTLTARVVECVFEDYQPKHDQYRIVSFYAKRARGLMMRYAIQNRVDTPEGLTSFDLAGYAYHAASSEPDRLVFRRKQAA